MIPGSAAIAAAIEDAEGIAITAMPISPSELFDLLPARAEPRTGDAMKVIGERAARRRPAAGLARRCNDPAVLVRAIPGCERLEALGEDAYAMTVAAGVGSIKGVYDGAGAAHRPAAARRRSGCTPHGRRRRRARSAADVLVTLEDDRRRHRRVTYDADAVVGGMIGGVGQRMLVGVAKRMAAEFFGNVSNALSEAGAGPARRRRGARTIRRFAPSRRARPLSPPPSSAASGPSARRRAAVVARRRVSSGASSGGRVRAGRWLSGAAAALPVTPWSARRGSGERGQRMTDLDVLHLGAGDGGRGGRQGDLRARADGPAPGPDRRGQPEPSTRSSPSTRSAPGPARPRPTSGWPRGEPVGPLHGLPHAFKDTHEVAGWRTTYGSPLRADYVPEARRARRRADPRRRASCRSGKTNVPEFAAGSHTFNPVFGTTLNPYDLTRSAGGSSGGAAAALASGMVPLADGSDMGGSLRNPASFCNVVGPAARRSGGCPSWPTPTAGSSRRSAARWRAASRTSRCCSR